MSDYHIFLCALAIVSTGCCLLSASACASYAAVVSLLAMIIAMLGNNYGLLLSNIFLLVATIFFVRGVNKPKADTWHRVFSNIMMVGVLTSLFLINGTDICGDLSLPLISSQGVASVFVPPLEQFFINSTFYLLIIYCCFSVLVLWLSWLRQHFIIFFEVLFMTLVTAGMATA